MNLGKLGKPQENLRNLRKLRKPQDKLGKSKDFADLYWQLTGFFLDIREAVKRKSGRDEPWVGHAPPP